MESERNFCRYDPLLGWAGIENEEGDFEWPDARHRVRQNRHGFRGAEHGFPRTSRKRTVVLGDSFAWGFGVEEEEIFTSVMEKSSGGALEVVNLGVSGYGTDQEYLLWKEKGRLWKPDTVVLTLTPYTDLADNLAPERYGYKKPFFAAAGGGELELKNVPVPERSGSWRVPARKVSVSQPGWMRFLLLNSLTANVVLNAALLSPDIRAYLEERGLIPARLAGYNWEPLLYYKRLDKRLAGAWDLLFRLIEKLRADVEGQGGEFRVCIVPSIVQVYPELWEKFVKDYSREEQRPNLDPGAPNKRIVEWCRKNGVPVTDLLPAFREAGKSDPYLYFPLNRHWTRAGHAVAAEALLQV